MNVHEAVRWVEAHIDYDSWAARSACTGNVRLSLDRMRRFASALGDPQARVPIIHVSGTNGKGSTSRMITRLLMAEGLRVGTYSSPHLAKYNERFRIDDVDVNDRALADLLTTIAAAEDSFGERLMPFELLTAAAYTWFAKERVDVAVVEVGVLGRFDATNVGDGRVAVITNIGFDHTNGEGDWARRIASEKAGVVKPGSHLILGEIEPRLEQLFLDERPRRVWRLDDDIRIEHDDAIGTGRAVTVVTPHQTLQLDVPLHGRHQATNCAIAVAAASAFLERALDPHQATLGIGQVRMPARMEVVRSGPTVLLDGAHNPDAAAALAGALADLPSVGRRHLVIGVLAGRDPASMLHAVEAVRYDTVITCTPPTPRGRPAKELALAAEDLGVSARAFDDIGDALATVLDEAADDDQIVVTGSMYLVADARAWLTRADAV